MVYYHSSDYNFLGFEKSRRKGKKYDAILQNIYTKRTTRVPFGASDYQHYKDSTGLNQFSYLDHGDRQRRKNYRARHKIHLKKGYYSPSHFAYYYLW
jgi:hypothetical protein